MSRQSILDSIPLDDGEIIHHYRVTAVFDVEFSEAEYQNSTMGVFGAGRDSYAAHIFPNNPAAQSLTVVRVR